MWATPRGRDEPSRLEEAQRHLRLRHSYPRLDRTLLRGCGIQGRQAHILVGIAGDLQPAKAAAKDVRFGAHKRGLHLRRGFRLLWPQWARGCGRRRGLAGESGRAASARAWSRADEHGWDPKGPPTLIDLRASLDGSGTITGWDSEFFIPQQTPNMFVVPLVAAPCSTLCAPARMLGLRARIAELEQIEEDIVAPGLLLATVAKPSTNFTNSLPSFFALLSGLWRKTDAGPRKRASQEMARRQTEKRYLTWPLLCAQRSRTIKIPAARLGTE
jgi:hypothetical protein